MGVYFPETCTGNHRRHALHLSWAELTLLDRLSQPDIPQFTATGSGMSFDMSKLWFRKKNTQVGNIFVLYSTSINWVPSMYLVLGYILVWVGPERRKNNKKSGRLAPGVSLSWLEHHPVMEGLWVQSLVWACAWLVGLIPLPGYTIPCLSVFGSQLIDASLSHQWFSLSLPLSPKAVIKCPWVTNKKVEELVSASKSLPSWRLQYKKNWENIWGWDD